MTHLSNLPRRTSKELRAEPDEEERDDLRQVEEGRRATEGEDGKPVRALKDPGALAIEGVFVSNTRGRGRRNSQLVGNVAEVVPDGRDILLALNFDNDAGDCEERQWCCCRRGRKRLTQLNDDSDKGEDEELSDEQEGRVACRDDTVRLGVRRRSLVTCDPAAVRRSAVALPKRSKETHRMNMGRINWRITARRGGTIPMKADMRNG